MTWVRLADDFADHPKVIAAGPGAGWLWVCSLAWANKYLTDGFIPVAAVRRLTDIDEPSRLAQRLVDVGLWERADGGYRIHDFEEYQPTAEAVRAEREQNRERMRSWRERQSSGRSHSVTYDVTDTVTNGVSAGSPVPAVNPAINPVPAGRTSPQPPPHAEGERALTPATTDDVSLWERARAAAIDGMLPANAERIVVLELLGRGPDGGLRLRAPPHAGPMARFVATIRSGLEQAGDEHGRHALIVTGGG